MANLSEKQWYVVSTFSQHERKAANNLLRRVESYNLQDKIFRVLVNEKEVDVLKDGVPTGKKKMKNQPKKMIMNKMMNLKETEIKQKIQMKEEKKMKFLEIM